MASLEDVEGLNKEQLVFSSTCVHRLMLGSSGGLLSFVYRLFGMGGLRDGIGIDLPFTSRFRPTNKYINHFPFLTSSHMLNWTVIIVLL